MRCPDCGQEKPEDEFPRNRRTSTGRGTYCKACHNARTRETVKRLYGDSREYHLRQKYGIGVADYDRMVAEQGGLCKVCRKRAATQIDHDHESGAIRGILCLYCNAALGALHDDPKLIERAIKYLERDRG